MKRLLAVIEPKNFTKEKVAQVVAAARKMLAEEKSQSQSEDNRPVLTEEMFQATQPDSDVDPRPYLESLVVEDREKKFILYEEKLFVVRLFVKPFLFDVFLNGSWVPASNDNTGSTFMDVLGEGATIPESEVPKEALEALLTGKNVIPEPSISKPPAATPPGSEPGATKAKPIDKTAKFWRWWGSPRHEISGPTSRPKYLGKKDIKWNKIRSPQGWPRGR